MKLLHYVEIENFKRFGEKQRIELDHPTVLIGPNNSGKSSAVQAIALWSQGVRAWYSARKESSASQRTGVQLNRLAIVSVPVQRARYFWHNMRTQGKDRIRISITIGVHWKGEVHPVGIQFYTMSDEVLHCDVDEATGSNMELLQHAVSINVELLYPMSGLTSEEPILKPGRINVLLGRGETAQVLRNLCLNVRRDSRQDWDRIVELMGRLFAIELGDPLEDEVSGVAHLYYRQPGVRDDLDIAMAGRGLQQFLLLFSYLFSHKKSVLLIDEPDAHLELLRQRQVYVLLRDVASANGSQVVIVTHSETVLREAVEHAQTTLLLEGRASPLASQADAINALKHYGASHYYRAKASGYILYVEGSTDVDVLRALAIRMGHPVSEEWDENINVYYVQDNYPESSDEKELERVEGAFGMTPRDHFRAMRSLLPELRGLGILDNDGKSRRDQDGGGLAIRHWRRYEAENYFVTPQVLETYALSQYRDMELFDGHTADIESVLADLVRDVIFDGSDSDYRAYASVPADARRLIWQAQTERRKLSIFAEEFFRRLAAKLNYPMLLRKGELHRLVELASPSDIHPEVSEKLDALRELLSAAGRAPIQPPEDTN